MPCGGDRIGRLQCAVIPPRRSGPALRHLPSWQSFYRFFGAADEEANIAAYWRFLTPHLDGETRAYWEGRGLFGRRRIAMFSRNVYRHGLLGHFIGFGHFVARAYGVDPRKILRARSLEEQRAFFETSLAPLFDKRLVRWLHGKPFGSRGRR